MPHVAQPHPRGDIKLRRGLMHLPQAGRQPLTAGLYALDGERPGDRGRCCLPRSHRHSPALSLSWPQSISPIAPRGPSWRHKSVPIGPRERSMNVEAKCPFGSDGGPAPAARGRNNADWWPEALNLKILHQQSSLSGPMSAGFDYADAFKRLGIRPTKRSPVATWRIRQSSRMPSPAPGSS